MTFMIILQQISAVLLVILVLMHAAKADGIAGIGGQANVYGSSNAQKELEKGLDQVTLITAVSFMGFSLLIAILS